jgi:hypothetical protein
VGVEVIVWLNVLQLLSTKVKEFKGFEVSLLSAHCLLSNLVKLIDQRKKIC